MDVKLNKEQCLILNDILYGVGTPAEYDVEDLEVLQSLRKMFSASKIMFYFEE